MGQKELVPVKGHLMKGAGPKVPDSGGTHALKGSEEEKHQGFWGGQRLSSPAWNFFSFLPQPPGGTADPAQPAGSGTES